MVLAPAVRADIELPRPFLPDSTLQRIDSIPPSAPVINVSGIWRGRGVVYHNGGFVSDYPYSHRGSISVNVALPDSLRQDFGYRLHLVDGQLPRKLSALPAGSWYGSSWRDGLLLSIDWHDGSTWRQDAFSFRMFVTAVDSAGNESQPSNIVTVEHDGVLDAQFERQTAGMGNYGVGSVELLAGNWVGKDEDGVAATLKLAGRQFQISSGSETYEGFAQVWKDEDGKQRITVDASGAVHFTGPYELQGDRLRLWLRVPATEKYYDLRRN